MAESVRHRSHDIGWMITPDTVILFSHSFSIKPIKLWMPFVLCIKWATKFKHLKYHPEEEKMFVFVQISVRLMCVFPLFLFENFPDLLFCLCTQLPVPHMPDSRWWRCAPLFDKDRYFFSNGLDWTRVYAAGFESKWISYAIVLEQIQYYAPTASSLFKGLACWNTASTICHGTTAVNFLSVQNYQRTHTNVPWILNELLVTIYKILAPICLK